MIKGRAMAYFETGMEGFEWCVLYEDPATKKWYNHFLQNGDRLKLFEERKEIWAGTIEKDTTINLTNETAYSYPRQVVRGMIVHWLPKGVNPNQWAEWLERGKDCELENILGENYPLHFINSQTGKESDRPST